MSQITVPVQFDGEVTVIANDGTTETGFATVNGQTFIVNRAVRRFGDWHGSPILPGFIVTTSEAVAEATQEAVAEAMASIVADIDAGEFEAGVTAEAAQDAEAALEDVILVLT